MPPPRVRFCPAPSGWLHVGGARTALYNWLHARNSNGSFIFRIEDTDAERVSTEAAAGMIEAMRFLGLDWDEGPDVEGPFGPYFQSERRDLYAAVAEALLAAGAAYDAYETPDELEDKRRAQQAAGLPPGYDGAHRDLSEEQREAFLAEGRRPVLRLRTPDSGAIAIEDLVRGRVEFAWKDISDFVIQRADGSPVYLLANTVDDLAMGISLVARGEDLLSATPRQLLLADLLLRDGLLDKELEQAELAARPAGYGVPTFAHLPLIVGEDRRPLSKRHGSVAIDEFRRQGYLPEVLNNFLALLGWSYDATTERMTVGELTERFSFDRVGSNPAFFDVTKLRSMNGDAIRELDDAQFAERLEPYFASAGLLPDFLDLEQQRLLLGLAALLRERVQTLAEAVPLVAFVFLQEVPYDDTAVAKHLRGRAGEVLEAAEAALSGLDEWTDETILAALDNVAERLELGRGKTFQPVRVAVAGSAVSPPLPETLALLDRERVLQRIQAAQGLVQPGG